MMGPPLHVLLTTATFEPGHMAGGPIRSVARIIDSAGSDVRIKALTSDRDLGSTKPYPGLSGKWVTRGSAEIHYLPTARVRHWFRVLSSLRRERFDLIYCNSLWDPRFTILPVAATLLGLIPAQRILVAPRGELSPGALRLKYRKKTAFLKLWRPLLDSKRVHWHASSPMEAKDIRAIWPHASVEIVEDQIDLPEQPLPAGLPAETAPLAAVFIGRISPKKNLLLVLEALLQCTSRVDFAIFGPVEDVKYWSRCEQIINDLPDHIQVRYCGVLDSGQVRSTFAGYELFLFPTLGENFGHVIAESLSASCAVLCSDQTPWSPVLADGGGTVLAAPTADQVATVIREIAELSSAERYKMRVRAGDAYRRWRGQITDENILGRISRQRLQKGTQCAS